jgi:hemolysin activation/secretion protein
MRRTWIAGVWIGAVLFAAWPAAAQQRVITREQLEPQRPERIAPERDEAPALEAPAAREEAPPPGGPSFVLEAVEIEGSSVYDQARLSALLADRIGEPVDFAGLFEITERIEGLYEADGYIAVRAVVPAQRIENGVVRIRVVEGAVAEVVLRGDLGAAAPKVRRLLERLVGRRPLSQAEAERQLLLARDLPGVSLLAALRARESETPGELVLLAEGVLTKADGFASVSNLASDFAGPFVATAGAAVNSLALPGDRLEAIGFSTLEIGEEALGQVTYRAPVGPDGLTLRLLASTTVSETGEALSILDIDYRSEILTAAVDYALVRTRERTVSLGAGLEYVHQESNAALPGIEIDEDLRVLFAEARLVESAVLGGQLDARGTIRGGLPGLGASEEGDRGLTRGADTDPQFVSAGVDLGWSRALGESLSLGARVQAQASSGNLPSFETFSLGNYTIGRGFEPGTVSGDHGVAGSLELSRALDIAALPAAVTAPSVFGFVESGRVWSEGPVDSLGLTSIGAGARWQLLDRVDVEAFVAVPVQSSDGVEDDDVQGLFRVTTFF